VEKEKIWIVVVSLVEKKEEQSRGRERLVVAAGKKWRGVKRSEDI
jgi:hypothetical protein